MPSKSEGTQDVKGWYHKTCTAPGRLDGKLAVVTGSSTGIGEVTAAELARRGCKVMMACRDLKRAQAAVDRILDKYGPSKPDSVKLDVADSSVIQYLSVVQPDQLVVEMLDLASLQSVREFASRISPKYGKLDYLINNVGIAQTKLKKSVDGFELTLATNHLGPFLLTELLTPMLKRAAPSRIINVSSMLHYNAKVWKPNLFIPETEYADMTAYNWSKLANVMHAKELSRRLEGTGVTAVSLHPEIVKTELARDLSGAFSLVLELLDLASLQSVRQFASRMLSKYNKLDFLINNAGVAINDYTSSVDGFEMTMATNHLGPFLLTEQLLPMLKRAAPSRIINVSSLAHSFSKQWKPQIFIPEKEYSIVKAYSWSKLANVMHARELSRRLEGTGVIAVSLHPGSVKTELARDWHGFLAAFCMTISRPTLITPWQGAQTTMYTVLSSNLVPGGYYSNCAVKRPSSAALNNEDCKWLWERSCELVGASSTE